MEKRPTVSLMELLGRIALPSHQPQHDDYRERVPPKAKAFTNVGFSNDDGRSDMYQSPAASISPPARRLSRRYSKWGVNQFIQTDERKKKDVIIIVAVLLLPIAALIGLTISQVVKSSTIRDDALQAQKDIENFLRVRDLVEAIQAERDNSAAYLLSNGTNRGLNVLVIGARQRSDIAMKKLDPWPKTNKSPTHMRTKGNLRLFLENHRAEVDDVSMPVFENSFTYSDIIHSIVGAAVSNVNLPEKGDLWRNIWAASEITTATDPLGVQAMLVSVFVQLCVSRTGDKYWFQELIGEYKKHLDGGLGISPTASQMYKTRAIDSGVKEKYLAVNQAISAAAYEQPCQLFNSTVRFGIFWGWNQDQTNYIAALRDVSEQLAAKTRDELDDIVEDAEREFVIYLVVLGVFVLGCFVLAIWTTISIYNMIENIITLTKESEYTSREIVAEKRKGDMLLYDILPPTVVDDIKKGKIVQVEYFDAVTICYLDIVKFVAMIAELTPCQVVTLLNNLYRMFDDIIENHNVHKIEQNNDVYCVASGVPDVTNKHTMNSCDFLLEIMERVKTFRISSLPDVVIQVRAGAHTGPCAAGIVGTTIPRYSVFGETVKIASRMSRTGEVMKIQISDVMKSALHARCGERYIVQERGEIDIYGKGKMKTHFLLGRKYSVGGGADI